MGRWGVMFDLGSTSKNLERELPCLQQNTKNVSEGNVMRIGELTQDDENYCRSPRTKGTTRTVEKKNLNPFYSSDMAAVIAVGGFR